MSANLDASAQGSHGTIRSAPSPFAHSTRVPVLDGFRGLAALLILIYHFMPTESKDGLLSWITHLNKVGWVGVDLFFALSGYLITGILLKAKGKPGYFTNFYMRRVLRIFPLYYGTMIAVFIVFPLVINVLGFQAKLESTGHLYEEYAYVHDHQLVFWLFISNLPGLVDSEKWWFFLSHFWSLSVEEHFYMVWPAVVLWLDDRNLLKASAGVVVACLLGRLVTYALYGPFYCYIATPLRIDGLLLGGIAAILTRHPQGLAHFRKPVIWSFSVAIGLLSLGFAYERTLEFFSPFCSTLGFTLTAIASTTFLVISLMVPGTSFLSKVLAGRFLGFFGKYSYSLYVFNRFLMLPCKKLFPAEQLGNFLGSPVLGAFANVILSIGLTSVFSIMSWNLFEKQFLKLKIYFEPSHEKISIPSTELTADTTPTQGQAES